MSSAEGIKLAEVIRQRLQELSQLCEKVDETTASQAPMDRWTPKQILSHLLGHEGGGLTKTIQTFLEQNTPQIDLDPGNHFYTEKRSQMTFAQLLSEVKKEYHHMADVVAGLSADQLARKAYIPALKESPLGEYPTLAVFVSGIVEHHVGFHINHMKEILEALGKV
jgi:hypothetical protein